MKAAVFSDTHRNILPAIEAIRLSRPDIIIHLGDHDRDAMSIHESFPDIPMYSVCGNCDIFPMSPEADVVPLGPITAYITHGHLYNVDYRSYDSLVYAAQERGAKIAMFGHTHRAEYTELGGVTVINPGTAGKGRNLTWAMVEVFDNGGIAVQIRDL